MARSDAASHQAPIISMSTNGRLIELHRQEAMEQMKEADLCLQNEEYDKSAMHYKSANASLAKMREVIHDERTHSVRSSKCEPYSNRDTNSNRRTSNLESPQEIGRNLKNFTAIAVEYQDLINRLGKAKIELGEKKLEADETQKTLLTKSPPTSHKNSTTTRQLSSPKASQKQNSQRSRNGREIGSRDSSEYYSTFEPEPTFASPPTVAAPTIVEKPIQREVANAPVGIAQQPTSIQPKPEIRPAPPPKAENNTHPDDSPNQRTGCCGGGRRKKKGPNPTPITSVPTRRRTSVASGATPHAVPTSISLPSLAAAPPEPSGPPSAPIERPAPAQVAVPSSILKHPSPDRKSRPPTPGRSPNPSFPNTVTSTNSTSISAASSLIPTARPSQIPGSYHPSASRTQRSGLPPRPGANPSVQRTAPAVVSVLSSKSDMGLGVKEVASHEIQSAPRVAFAPPRKPIEISQIGIGSWDRVGVRLGLDMREFEKGNFFGIQAEEDADGSKKPRFSAFSDPERHIPADTGPFLYTTEDHVLGSNRLAARLLDMETSAQKLVQEVINDIGGPSFTTPRACHTKEAKEHDSLADLIEDVRKNMPHTGEHPKLSAEQKCNKKNMNSTACTSSEHPYSSMGRRLEPSGVLSTPRQSGDRDTALQESISNARRNVSRGNTTRGNLSRGGTGKSTSRRIEFGNPAEYCTLSDREKKKFPRSQIPLLTPEGHFCIGCNTQAAGSEREFIERCLQAGMSDKRIDCLLLMLRRRGETPGGYKY